MACATSSTAQLGYDTIKVYFPINVTSLDAVSQKKLDSITQLIGTKKILIYGYADYLGNEPANMSLAETRAVTVKKYLISRKINAQQILVCAGIGEVNRKLGTNKEGYPEDRRVAIFIKKESIDNALEHKFPKTKENPLTINPKGSKHKILSLDSKPIINSRFDELSELQPNEVMRVESIHFQATRHFITKDSEPILQELLQTLKDYPNLAIRIEGHVCCMTGDGDALDTDTYELKLSENRAQHIYQYLIANGIDKSRLEHIGFGKRKPIVAIEKSEEDAQKNRRVEIRVLRN
jgi:outer membrane protein OmpA-like peptidoglycan-associated protein